MPDDFEVEVRPVGPADSDGNSDGSGFIDYDVIDVGGPPRRRREVRRPGWVERVGRIPTAVLIAGVIAAVGVAVLVSGTVSGTANDTGAGPPIAETTPTVTAGPVGPIDPGAQSLAAMVEVANSGMALRDFVISDDVHPSCPRGAADDPDPVTTIVGIVTRYLPQYTVVDSARGQDLAGICSIEIRERSANGSVLIVTVVAPPNQAEDNPVIVVQGNDRTTSVDVVAVNQGWWVEVGATGQTGEQPTAEQVADLAVDARLVW
jgi:hypothetical protein